jgi:CheY-like chemotaxis protein
MKRSILMLEHDDDDRYITQTTIGENRYPVKVEFVATSDDLFAYMTSCEKGGTKFPELIMLNYFASPVNAVEILKRLKSNIRYAHIPVVILSGTVNNEILRKCYTAGASSFIVKPSSSEEVSKKISSFVKYWFETVELVH